MHLCQPELVGTIHAMGDIPLEDRRGFTRLPTTTKVVVKVSESRRVLGRLQDIGLCGVGLVVPLDLHAGDRVQLCSIAEPVTNSASFRVVWIQSEELPGWCRAGLCFEGTMADFLQSWVSHLFAGAESDTAQLLERRRFIRIPTRTEADVLVNGVPHPGVILNLGTGGVLLTCAKAVAIGTSTRLRIPPSGLVLDGTVVDRRREDPYWYYSISFTQETQTMPGFADFLSDFGQQALRQIS